MSRALVSARSSESRWVYQADARIMRSVRRRVERSPRRRQRKTQRLVYSSSKQSRQVSPRSSSALGRWLIVPSL